MPDDFQQPSDPPVRSTERLDELESQLLRQKEFVRWLHSITALPYIIGGAQREQAKLEAAVESERRCSSNDKLRHRHQAETSANKESDQ